MAKYEMGGKLIETDGELSPEDINQIAQQFGSAPSDPNADKSVLGEAGHSAWRSLAQVGQGIASLADTFGPAASTPEDAEARRQRRTAAAEQYKHLMSSGPAVPTWDDIHSGHDAALYVADKLGAISPYALSMGMGFVPGAAKAVVPSMMTTGAVQFGEQEAEQPNATPASVGTAAGLGGAIGGIQVPFLTGAGGVLSRTAKAALLGGPTIGAAQGLTGNIPRAVASGNPEDAIPDTTAIREAIIGNAIGMGAMGGAHAGAEKALAKVTGREAPAPVAATPEDSARVRLADRIRDAAEQNEYDLQKVNYDAPDGAKAALDTVHNTLAEDIKGVWELLKDDLAPSKAADVESLLERTGLAGIMRSARNKVKGDVGTEDLQKLTAAVGHTEEGRVLVDLVRQSNELSDLFRSGFKGGVSRFTDYLNPLGHGGRETGYTSALRLVAPKAVEAGLLLHNPALAAPMVAGFAGGRAIDALTGRRSTVGKFVRDNRMTAQPLDMQGATSVLRERAKAEALKKSVDTFTAQQAIKDRSIADETKAIKEQMDRLQRSQDVQTKGLNDAVAAFTNLQGIKGRSQSRVQTEQEREAAAAEQERLTARERELRTQNRLDNNPGLGGFDRSIYDQTGIRPADAVPGVFELFRTGRITPTEFHSFFDSPRDLMSGNAGNHIIDMLDQMARNGALERDPQWKGQTEAVGSYLRPEQPQTSSIHNRAAYEAQAAGNQSRVTEAQSRVAASEHAPEIKQAINDGIAAIGRSNNRADAEHVRQSLIQALSTHSPEAARYAHQELEPLIKQIRHATPEAATARSIPKGADLRPVTTDVTRDGNHLTRTLAAAYKLKAGVKKPAYDGKREPDESYLREVADYHDKAVHSPDDPAVKHSYAALKRETVAQFKHLGGLKVETWRGEGEPYRNSKEMMRDVADNHHLWFLPTESAFGANGEEIAHPMLEPTGLKTVDGHPLLLNDVFRIVHDFYGHTQHGFQFGPVGEYNAFREHAQMYSDAALPALAAETLAQNAWVNFGPHLRRLNGSVPGRGEPDYIAPPDRPFSEQKAYAFPPELIERDPNLGRELVDHIYDHPADVIPSGKEIDLSGHNALNLDTAIPGWKGISQFLTPAEQGEVTKRTAANIVKHFQNLPPATEMASVAYSGRAKRGWYRQSAKAIVSIFGQADAPRFAALLAALSPQTSVESNLTNALNVWRGWIEADRPRDEPSIMRILGENVEGDKGPGSVLPAWVNNSLRALTAADGEPLQISGPKVSSFAHNLLGEVHEVTNDTWMANWAGVEQTLFRGTETPSEDGIGKVFKVKNAGYMAMNALTRKAAAVLTKRTGEEWTPAEVQETVWSWAKAISEKANSKQSVTQLVKEQAVSHEEINAVPDFERLFVSDTYARILDEAGYGDYVDNLKYTLEERAANNGGNSARGTPFTAEGAGIGQDALLRDLVRSAKRLDALKAGGTDTGRATKAADLSQGEFIVAKHVTPEAAQKVADAMGKYRSARVEKQPDGEYAVVLGPKPNLEYPTAEVPAERAYTDPEGRQGAASFISGIEHPDGTTRGLTTPEIRAVAKSISRLVEGDGSLTGVNGIYSEGNNVIRIGKGLSPSEHDRVLGHETGHAIEALANVVGILDRGNPSGDRRASPAAKTLDLVKELSAVSRLERPHLWASDEVLELRFSRPAKQIHEYRTRLDELFADNIRHYMTDPASMKKVAPTVARFIRDLVNPSKIGKVIAFTSLAGLTLPGIIAQALAALYQGNDQKEAPPT